MDLASAGPQVEDPALPAGSVLLHLLAKSLLSCCAAREAGGEEASPQIRVTLEQRPDLPGLLLATGEPGKQQQGQLGAQKLHLHGRAADQEPPERQQLQPRPQGAICAFTCLSPHAAAPSPFHPTALACSGGRRPGSAGG